MSQVTNITIQVRGRLQQLNIKLWEPPYYDEEIGRIEAEMDRLVEDFSQALDISSSLCRMALEELQDGALRKLAARKEFDETGIATFNVRHINQHGTQNIFEMKCAISATGAELCQLIADKLQVGNANRIKCIVSGKILDPEKVLLAQGISNNFQMMVIVSEIDETVGHSKDAMYDRIHKIKMDVETLVDSNRQLIEMEDQDGKPIFLPPEENRALLMGMGLYEKARVFLKRQHYDEALLLLIDADEQFSTCNSQLLENVDNYGLLNLDIVWCYLCLKNVTQLPDADRRLRLCEKIFERSYGADLSRVRALKGHDCAERAIVLRLNLLKGVVFFHQNLRNEAYNYLELAASELRHLKVDDSKVTQLVEMGYDTSEALLALRCCAGDVERSIQFIHEQRDKLEDVRKRTEKERRLGRNLQNQHNDDGNWVNPRSVCTLMDMGFARELVVEALKRTSGDITKSLELLQNYSDDLAADLPPPNEADSAILDNLMALGFTEEMARLALETTQNDLEGSIDFLLKLYDNEEDLLKAIQRVSENMTESSATDLHASRSSVTASRLAELILQKAAAEMESLKAFERFHQDLPENENDYLDMPLIHEEQLIAEYMAMLQN